MRTLILSILIGASLALPAAAQFRLHAKQVEPSTNNIGALTPIVYDAGVPTNSIQAFLDAIDNSIALSAQTDTYNEFTTSNRVAASQNLWLGELGYLQGGGVLCGLYDVSGEKVLTWSDTTRVLADYTGTNAIGMSASPYSLYNDWNVTGDLTVGTNAAPASTQFTVFSPIAQRTRLQGGTTSTLQLFGGAGQNHQITFGDPDNTTNRCSLTYFSGLYSATITVSNTGAVAFYGDRVNVALPLVLDEASEPDDPADGKAVLWFSNGTGAGNDGDVLIKKTVGGVTTTNTVDLTQI